MDGTQFIEGAQNLVDQIPETLTHLKSMWAILAPQAGESARKIIETAPEIINQTGETLTHGKELIGNLSTRAGELIGGINDGITQITNSQIDGAGEVENLGDLLTSCASNTPFKILSAILFLGFGYELLFGEKKKKD